MQTAMRTLLLVLATATLALSQQCQPPSQPDAVCLGLRLQDPDLAICSQELANLATQLDPNVFCASQCAVTLRTAYDCCGYTGPLNQIQLLCSANSLISPDVTCLATELQSRTDCLNIFAGDPTAFCTSTCGIGLRDSFQRCGYPSQSNPINFLCQINLTSINVPCLAARLSTLSNCALELLTSTSVFCQGQCVGSVRDAFNECGFTGQANIVNTVCAPGAVIQDPVCVQNRLTNLGGCLETFLMNVSTFCDSSCSDAFAMAYDGCGYSGSSNPITLTCTNRNTIYGDDLCLASRLQTLTGCLQQITTQPAIFCNSTCVTQLEDAYVDCGYFREQNPAIAVCANVGGPDPICLADRLGTQRSCINTFLTAPTTFCSSECYTDLRDAYSECGYTDAFSNPFASGCFVQITEDPICLARGLLNLQDCASIILTNISSFCQSDCRNRVSTVYRNCGFSSSDPTAICASGLPTTDIDLCLATRLPTVGGCLSDFLYSSSQFCTTDCAMEARRIYDECGYTSLYRPNPVESYCNLTTSGPDPLCLGYGMQNQTGCLAVFLTNSSSFCSSECATSVSAVYNRCGFTGFSNPVETSCTYTTTFNLQDPVCLSTRVQTLTPCLARLITDRGTFCTSDCASMVSDVYNGCGYTGFANPAYTCNYTIPDTTTTCLSSSTVYQNCIAEISLNPSSFCTSNCVRDLQTLFSSCGIPPTLNPATTFCNGLIPNTPGTVNPTCLTNAMQGLQQCVGVITTSPTTFCSSQCATDLSTSFAECGLVNDTNPVSLLCTALPASLGDLTCLNSALSNIQSCISELAADPSRFCSSQCSTDLSNAYISCGFVQTANPVTLACGGGLPGQDPFCISGRLTGLQDCTARMADQDFCGSECEGQLRAAYSECGFTGTTNPIALLCSGANGSPDTICLGTQFQLQQECISELFSKPQSLCSVQPEESRCPTTVRNAYTMCGYTGTQNPIQTTCSEAQTGGAVTLQAIPMIALTLILLAIAIMF